MDTTRKVLDWTAGKETGVRYSRSVPNWKPSLPPGESQKTLNMDTSECDIFSGTHSIVAQINYDLSAGNYSKEAVDFFTDSGYIVDGVFNVSELFNAKLAGTNREGTYMSAMGNSYRHDGLLPQADLPLRPGMTWDEFDALVVTDAMKTKAKELLLYVEPQYQWIDGPVSVQDLLLAPVQLAIGVCPGWSTDSPVKACSDPMQHCVACYSLDGGVQIQDTYVPFLKTLAPNYKVYAAMQFLAFPRMPVRALAKPAGAFTMILSTGSPYETEIERVQTFLAWEGCLDPKYICGVYGPRTTQAIMDFQYKYEYAILKPAGVSAPTGKWGSYTIAQANKLLSA